MRAIKLFLVLCAVVLLFNSCLGVSADIVIRANGSGKITLEYRVSQMLESVGRLDGNARFPAIPVGRTDFERSLARIPGLELLSFSTKEVRNSEGGADLLTRVALEFNNIDALLAFLDSSGTHASLVHDNGKPPGASHTVRLVMMDSAVNTIDPDLLSLAKELSRGYEISVSLTAPKNAALSVLSPSAPTVRLVGQGKKVSFSIAVSELLTLTDGLAIEITY